MFVIGTAGHIDHGKSALVRRMTGIDPDRLPEEKKRGMTIDLGFAWVDLPSGKAIGIVDVPGHERFIRNMVAGVGGIDAVILVIAADDGWMPQTDEHFNIIKMLEIKTGLVALTKKDLVESDFLELQADDIRDHLKSSFLESCPIVPVSGTTGEGIDDILNSIDSMLTENIQKPDKGAARLFIDRRFTIQGIGTVVTGTLQEGCLEIDQSVDVQPSGLVTRIRSLQTHKEKIEKAVPGSRVAVNLAGIERMEISRGDALCSSGSIAPTDRLAVQVALLDNTKYPLKSGFELSFLLGTSEIYGRVYLLETDLLKPGERSFARIHLVSPVAAKLGDNFILRRISPQDTIGGGKVLDTDVILGRKTKHKQLELLRKRKQLSPATIIETELIKSIKFPKTVLNRNLPFTMAEIDMAIEDLKKSGVIVVSGNDIISGEFLEKYAGPAVKIIEKQHETCPWSDGIEPGRLAKKLKLRPEKLPEVIEFLITNNMAENEKGFLRIPGFKAELKPDQQALKNKLLARLSASPLAAPARKEFIDDDPGYEVVINFLRDRDEIIELKGGILFTERDFKDIISSITKFLQDKKEAKAADIKNHLRTSRKYIIPILERLDHMGVTIRDGDFRKLKN